MSSESPATILFDQNGNAIGVVQDGIYYRLQVEAKISDGYNSPAILPGNTAAMSGDPSLVVAISPNNPITTSTAKSTTSNTFDVPASTSTTTLLNANSIRLGATIYNNTSSGLFYIKLGLGASTSDYTIKLLPSMYYPIPFNFVSEVSGVWSIASGSAKITELT